MDKQEDIYKQAMQYLDDAIADLQQEDLIDPASQDLLLPRRCRKMAQICICPESTLYDAVELS